MSAQSFHLQQIKLSNFKNYSINSFEFSEKLNFVLGNNGIGKTNLLDAVYYSCLSKSYLTSDLMIPNFADSYFRLEANFLLNSDNQFLELKYSKHDKKQVFINKVKLEKQAELIGKFPCVMITPDDNQLILGTSELRRKFMDATLSQLSIEYLTNLITYNKVLAQRNALLKSFYEHKNFDKTLLDIYNQQLIKTGNVVFSYRKTFIDKFITIFKNRYKTIFEGNEEVDISYISDLQDNNFESVLNESENADRNAQRTTKGIHTDDLIFELNNYPIRKIGSQGQQKTFLLSLKLAQYELLKAEKQVKPILLLDDIFDKLDLGRITKIFQLINSDGFGQSFISDTDENAIQALISENQLINYKLIKLE